jgi:hypothetical protein
LRIVESAGDFLAVARHERHGSAAVKQFDGRRDLLLANAEFFRDLSIDICHGQIFPETRAASESLPPPEAAYGPSQIISSRRRGKQIDLWMALIEQFNICKQPVAMTQDKGGSMAL